MDRDPQNTRRGTGRSPSVIPQRTLLALIVVVAAVVAAWFRMDDLPEPDSESVASSKPAKAHSDAQLPPQMEPRPHPQLAQEQPAGQQQQPAAAGVAANPTGEAQPATRPKPAPEPEPEPSAEAEAPTTVQSAASSSDIAWYRSTPGSKYTLQLFGTRSQTRAKAFIRGHGAGYRYFAKQLNGEPFYVVTYGLFDDHDAAVAGLKSLPSEVQATKPWPRSLASIQQELPAY